MGKRGRPKGYVMSEESRAKLRAAWAAKFAGPEREAARQKLIDQLRKANERRSMSSRVPPFGTPERRLFEKIRQALGSAVAHAEIRRGV